LPMGSWEFFSNLILLGVVWSWYRLSL